MGKCLCKYRNRPYANGKKTGILRTAKLICLFLMITGLSDRCLWAVNPLPLAAVGSGLSLSEQKKAEDVENQIKAAFIYNFMKFTDWPPEKADSGKTDHPAIPESSKPKPMIIGIVGDNPFKKSFEPLLDKTIKDRPIRVVEFPSLADYQKKHPDVSEAFQAYFRDHLSDLRSSHVLYFCESERGVIRQFLKAIEGAGTLTISDVDQFARIGGIIGFVKEDKKIRFEINLTRSEDQKMKISSQLLKLAREVIREERHKTPGS